MKPDTGSFTDRLYADLEPLAYADESYGWPLLTLLAALGETMFQQIEGYARDTADGPGWSVIVDIDRAPPETLAWLAQFVGARLRTGLAPEAQRARVASTSGFHRGSVDALVGAAQPLLTGARQVILHERDGGPYTLTVITYTAETPDPTAVEAALLEQKPAGLILNYEVRNGQDYATLLANHPTYTAVNADYANYEAVRDDLP